MPQVMFDNLSGLQYLDILTAATPEALTSMIESIRLPTKIHAVWFGGGYHHAMIQTTVRLKKVPRKEKKNERSKG